MKRLRTFVVAATLVALVAVTGVESVATLSAQAGGAAAFSSGTVLLADNDAGAAVVSLTNADAGATAAGCIVVSYSGSIDASVRLYGSSTGTLPAYLGLKVTRGTQASPSFSGCTGFTADATDYVGAGAGVVYAGTLQAYPATYGAGLDDPAVAGGTETWTTGEAHVYRIELTVRAEGAGQGQSGAATLHWQARNL
jgi:hypothetical protein